MKDKFGGFAETCMEGACQVARFRRWREAKNFMSFLLLMNSQQARGGGDVQICQLSKDVSNNIGQYEP